jgi:hypothetical protein
MAKTLVQKEICDACGAEVRPGSIFCYSCGGEVADDSSRPPKSNTKREVSQAQLPRDLSDSADQKTADIDLKTTRLTEETVRHVEIPPIAKPSENPFEEPPLGRGLEKIQEQRAEKPAVHQEGAKLKSAASMRRKAKSFQRKTVEVVWEEPENAPNKWFPLVAVVLMLLVAGIIYLAMYLK